MYKKLCFMLLFFLLLTGCVASKNIQSQQYIKCELVNVIDGDTLSVMYDGKLTKVRLIGIDTPESVHSDEEKNSEYGNMASEYTQKLLADVGYVYLEFDVAMYDDYDRLLAYAYLSEEQTFVESLNYILVNDGYAINKEFAPNIRYAEQLQVACEYARKNNVGLWEEYDKNK